MPSKRDHDGKARKHTSSGTQQEHLSIERLKPAAIHNNQATVNQTLSDQSSVLEQMVRVALAELRGEEFPKMRAGQDPSTKR